MDTSKLFLVVLIFLLFSCSNDEDSAPSLLIRRNCGEVIRVWSQNTSSNEGNPCGDNGDASRRFGIIVKNQFQATKKYFVNHLQLLHGILLEGIIAPLITHQDGDNV